MRSLVVAVLAAASLTTGGCNFGKPKYDERFDYERYGNYKHAFCDYDIKRAIPLNGKLEEADLDRLTGIFPVDVMEPGEDPPLRRFKTQQSDKDRNGEKDTVTFSGRISSLDQLAPYLPKNAVAAPARTTPSCGGIKYIILDPTQPERLVDYVRAEFCSSRHICSMQKGETCLIPGVPTSGKRIFGIVWNSNRYTIYAQNYSAIRYTSVPGGSPNCWLDRR